MRRFGETPNDSIRHSKDSLCGIKEIVVITWTTVANANIEAETELRDGAERSYMRYVSRSPSLHHRVTLVLVYSDVHSESAVVVLVDSEDTCLVLAVVVLVRRESHHRELFVKHVLVPFLHELVRVPNRYAGARLGELWRGAHARGDRCKVVGECGGGVLRS